MSSETRRKTSDTVFTIHFSSIATSVVSLPLVGFISCVIISLVYDFEHSTATHCRVPNYLPSISAAIGGSTPQQYIWRVSIALHCSPRFMVPISYYRYFMNNIGYISNRNLYRSLVLLSCSLHTIEIISLIGLTYVSSSDNKPLHENFFISFMVCSQLYMIFMCILFKWSKTTHQMDLKDLKSFQFKVVICIINISSFFIALYFYFRHNKYCEAGVYTMFALLEYVVVVTNIGFHYTASCDMGNMVVYASLNGKEGMQSLLP